MPTSASYTDPTRRTIAGNERRAAHYSTLVGPVPPPVVQAALRRIIDVARLGSQVLEIGSDPGRDADLLETFGVDVHRTGHEIPRHWRGTFCAALAEPLAQAQAQP